MILGLAALGITAFLVSPGPQSEANFKVITGWQMTWPSSASCSRHRRPPHRPRQTEERPGFFRWFSALHMWVVSPQRVEAVPLESLTDIDGTLYRGAKNFAKIVLTFPTGRREFMIPNPDRTKLEFLVRPSSQWSACGIPTTPVCAPSPESSPALTGALAARLAPGENVGDLVTLTAGEEPPRPPRRRPPDGPSRR